jgi:PhoH-like ATPase
MKKLFVVDTNVVLFDHTCIYNFQEHDVALSIVVLEELDRFKRGNDLINLEARQFIRELDDLASRGPIGEGLPLGEDRGRLFLEIGEPANPRVSQAFALSKADHRILALADELRARRQDRQVIVVSKDVNLRIKAKSLGLPAEDYTTGTSSGSTRAPPAGRASRARRSRACTTSRTRSRSPTSPTAAPSCRTSTW